MKILKFVTNCCYSTYNGTVVILVSIKLFDKLFHGR